MTAPLRTSLPFHRSLWNDVVDARRVRSTASPLSGGSLAHAGRRWGRVCRTCEASVTSPMRIGYLEIECQHIQLST